MSCCFYNLSTLFVILFSEKPYKCSLCTECFPDNRPLKKHRALVHGEHQGHVWQIQKNDDDEENDDDDDDEDEDVEDEEDAEEEDNNDLQYYDDEEADPDYSE